jgi:hypothetical protein
MQSTKGYSAMTPVDGHGSEQNPQDIENIIDLEDFIDPKGYWADPDRNIRRTSGNQETILKVTDACTKGEWIFLLESLGIEGSDN